MNRPKTELIEAEMNGQRNGAGVLSEADLEAGGALFALLNNDKSLAQQCVSRLGNNGVADLTMAAFRLGDMAREEQRIRERKGSGS